MGEFSRMRGVGPIPVRGPERIGMEEAARLWEAMARALGDDPDALGPVVRALQIRTFRLHLNGEAVPLAWQHLQTRRPKKGPAPIS
jgi:hypothetical protein